MMKRIAVAGLVVAACGLAGAGTLTGVSTAAAEEVRQQLNAPMILNLMARPLESPEAAFNKELKNNAIVASKGDERGGAAGRLGPLRPRGQEPHRHHQEPMPSG